MKSKKQCINCSKEFEQPEGKREKKFCSDKCRATFNQKDHTRKIILVEDENGEWKTPDGRKASLRWSDEQKTVGVISGAIEIKTELPKEETTVQRLMRENREKLTKNKQ